MFLSSIELLIIFPHCILKVLVVGERVREPPWFSYFGDCNFHTDDTFTTWYLSSLTSLPFNDPTFYHSVSTPLVILNPKRTDCTRLSNPVTNATFSLFLFSSTGFQFLTLLKQLCTFTHFLSCAIPDPNTEQTVLEKFQHWLNTILITIPDLMLNTWTWLENTWLRWLVSPLIYDQKSQS